MTRYARLFDWALRLADGRRAEAEDLVQDAFVQFTLAAPDLDRIEHLDAYLYGMLRRLRISQARRAARRAECALAVVDYDSAELTLRQADSHAALQAQIELAIVCAYACHRKESSKTGSVMLLRFFHGYAPSETARVLRLDVRAVDEWRRIARQEARACLDSPDGLAFMRGAPPPAIPRASVDAPAFLRSLRETIFASRRTPCPAADVLDRRYEARGSHPALTCAEAAHVASCPRCLDAASTRLGLPRLSERFPDDALDRGRRPRGDGDDGPGGASGDGGNAHRVRRARQRARDVFEHEPDALLVAVNGLPMLSLKVSGEAIDQVLTVPDAAELDSVEVFSEQGVCLLLMGVDPLASAGVHQAARVHLSRGRRLELSLDRSAVVPRLRLRYERPHHAAALAEPAVPAAARTAPSMTKPAAARLHDHEAGWPRRLLRALAGWTPTLKAATIAVVLGVVVGGGLWRWATPRVSAAELLQAAHAWEQQAVRGEDLLLRRFEVVERRAADRAIVTRRTLDVLQRAAPRTEVRRTHDEHGLLLSGEWIAADGTSTLYRRHMGAVARPPVPDLPALDPRLLASALRDGTWRWTPAGAAYRQLMPDVGTLRVLIEAGTYTLTNETAGAAGGHHAPVIRLVLSRAERRPIALVLIVGAGAERRAFEVRELSVQRLARAGVSPDLFDVDAALLRPARISRSSGDRRWPVSHLIALEIDALHRLDQVGALYGERVSVTRDARGVRVEALADTTSRKQELLSALAAVTRRGPVRLTVRGPRDVVADAAAVQVPAVRELEATPNHSAAFERLHARLERLAAADASTDAGRARQAGDETWRFADRLLRRSQSLKANAWALESLAGRFTDDEVAHMDADALLTWTTLIRRHAHAVRDSSIVIRLECQQAFDLAVSEPPDDDGDRTAEAPAGVAILGGRARGLAALATQQDDRLRALLAATDPAAPPAPAPDASLAEHARRIEHLAQQLLDDLPIRVARQAVGQPARSASAPPIVPR